MKYIKQVILITPVFLLLVLPCVNAEYSFEDIETLRGIKSLFIFIQSLPREAQAFGLTREKMQKDIVSKIEMAGIKVVSYNDWYDVPGSPYLFIGIGILPLPQHGDFTTTIHLELRQIADLKRNPELSYHATTWMRGETLYVKEAGLKSVVRDSLNDWLDLFLYDYLTVNPRETDNGPR